MVPSDRSFAIPDRRPLSSPRRSPAARIAGVYLLAGLLWIGLSDLTVAGSGGFASTGFLLSIGKGVLFVVLSAALLFWLIRREDAQTARAIAMLRDTDARLREAQRIAGLGSWTWEPPSNRLWWSDAEFELFGVDPTVAHASFASFLACVHPDDRAIATARLDAMRQGANAFANDLRVIRPDGRCVWIHSQARATRDAAGALIRVDGTDQDITEQREAREAVREQAMLLREASELAKVGGWGFDPITLESDWTPEVARMYGFAVEAPPAVGEALTFFAAEQRPVLEAALAAAIEHGTPHDLELQLVTADGVKKWVRTICRPTVEDGRVIRVRGSLQEITDRKRAEAELQASERRLRLALESAGAVAFIWDIPSDVVTRYYSSEPALPPTAAETLNGFRANIHPNDLPRFDAVMAACLAAGSEYHNEYRLIRPDGTVVHLEDRGFLDRADDGSPLALTGIVFDVTARVLATDSLRSSEERLREAAHVAGFGVFEHDHQSELMYWSPRLREIYGIEQDAPADLSTYLGLIHPADRASIERAIHRAHDPNGDGRFDVEHRLVRCSDRHVLWLATHAHTQFVGEGADRRALRTVGATVDLTERERATALLRSVQDSVGDAILTIDEHGAIASGNQASERLFGYAEAEIVGKHIDTILRDPHTHADERPPVERLVGVGRELEGRRKDGTMFPIESTITPFNRDGAREFTGVLRDITVRRQLEEQLRQSQKMEAIGRLAGGVAHDFNNLLTVINGYTDLLLSEAADDDAARGALDAIHDAGDRAARLTQQLLAFSRKSVVEPKLVDLNALVAQSAELLRRLIGEDVVLEVTADALPVRTVLDPGQFEQILMNLVVNARDAMPTGGRILIETRTVTTDITPGRRRSDLPPGRYACLVVTDTGVGMSVDVKERIFEPFFTTKGLGQGTGLGLAVVHGVVTQAGGSVAVESIVGKTTFTVMLPSATSTVTAPQSSASPVIPRGSETVLVVEDEDAVRRLVRAALERQGYTVLLASGGEGALAVLRAQSTPVHLMLTDVIMPGLSGRALVEVVRASSPALPVLFMSGYTDDALDRHGLSGTSDHFIQKPFTPLGLAQRVREILDHSSATAQH